MTEAQNLAAILCHAEDRVIANDYAFSFSGQRYQIQPIRLMEVLLHTRTRMGGWSTKQIHEAVLATFQLTARQYGINQFRYDLLKMKPTD